MDFIPGDPDRHPPRVAACAARSSELREAERDLLLRGLIAVQLDAHARLTCDEVHRDALQQLRIPGHTLQVTRISKAAFLLRFETPELRNFARARGTLSTGICSLHLMPWGRQADASDASLPYRARVCLEGVPAHAHQVETVLHLLPKRSFVEAIDYAREREDEKGCFILWIWCKDPDALSVYNILIHLDRVEDYSPPSNTTSRRSFESDISGVPNDETTREWPEKHSFIWHLGTPDALPDPPRASVHSRLGARRDLSPPRGGGLWRRQHDANAAPKSV
ncbi:unnamed protein product [Urochloa humidicola]